MGNAIKETPVPPTSIRTRLARLVSRSIQNPSEKPHTAEDRSRLGIDRSRCEHQRESDDEVLDVVGMRTLHAVEGVLGGVLLGLFMRSIGVGVSNLGGLANRINDDGVPLADDTSEGNDGENVAEDEIVSTVSIAIGEEEKRGGNDGLPMLGGDGDGSHD